MGNNVLIGKTGNKYHFTKYSNNTLVELVVTGWSLSTSY